MKYILTLFLWFSCLGIMAQHNLYRWQLKGYTGVANYYNPDKSNSSYFKLDHNLWHQFEIGRSLGNTFGLSASAAFGNISGLGLQGSSFTTEARLTAAKLYFYTDNGWLLKPTSFVSPYFFGGYGLTTFTNNPNDVPSESKYRQVVPFGMGLKFRLTERWQLDLQTEAVYSIKSHANPSGAEQNKYNNAFLHTGLALAYNFGFKKSGFKAARFYVGFRDTLSQVSSSQSVSCRPAKPTTVPTPLSPTNHLVNPKLVAIPDTIIVSKQYEPQLIDSLRYKRITIQQSDTIPINNRSRTVVRKSPMRQDSGYAEAKKTMKDREISGRELNSETKMVDSPTRAETVRIREELRPSNVNYDVPGTNTGTYVHGSREYESNTNLLNRDIILLLEKDRRELDAANKKNQQLRFTRDSLSKEMPNDTIHAQQSNRNDSLIKFLDDKTIKYMQQQATLNDSIRQRLAFYEKELTRLRPVAALTPVNKPQPIGKFDTNVYFRINSYEVPSQSFNELLALADFLKANPNLKLQLTGYTDQTGNQSYNQVLSRKRVEVIAAFFQSQGIEQERLLVQYFGEIKSDGSLNSLNRKVVLKTIN